MNHTKEPAVQELEVMRPDALEQLERASIDMKISTAKKYPRDIKKFIKEAETMISLDEDTAESCNYALKRQGKTGVTFIKGPSIRLLEICASAYGNISYGSRTIAIDGEFVTAQGVSHDLEKNVSSSVEIKRSIVGKEGRRYSQDMVMVTANAAGAIARRNALKGVVPVAYVNKLAEFALKVAVGDAKTLPQRLQSAFDYFIKVLALAEAQILKWLEKPNRESCTVEDVESLTGLKTALKEGETTLDEEFPREPSKPAQEAGSSSQATPTGNNDNPIPKLTELLKSSEVTEEQLLAYCKAQPKDSPVHAGKQIEELAQLAVSKILALVNTWPQVVAVIKEAK